MATGRLGAVDLAAITNTSVYKSPEFTVVEDVLINFANRNATVVTLRLAIIDGDVGDIANEDYLLYDVRLDGNESSAYCGLKLSPEMTIMAYSNTANVSVIATGQEKSFDRIGI